MPFQTFLNIEGIEGESTDKFHPHEIEIDAFSWGETQVGSSGSGSGGGAGKTVLRDFNFSMATSLASPNLMLACATGHHSPRATVTCRAGNGFEFLKIKLSDVLVTSYDIGSNALDAGYSMLDSSANTPTDEISLSFVKIDMLYTVQRTGETIETTFDNGTFGA